MPAFPISRYLVPAQPAASDARFTQLQAAVTTTLPFAVALDGQTSLRLSIPTGLGVQWLDADPSAILSSSAMERGPQPVPALPLAPLDRTPLRLYVRSGGAVSAAIPLVAGLQATFASSPGGGTNYEVRIIDWEIRVGNVHGDGNFGSYVTLAWRRADAAAMQFSTPPVNPNLWWRLPVLRIPRIESWLNVRVRVPVTLAESLVLRRGAYDVVSAINVAR
jgi:hypothetical protein